MRGQQERTNPSHVTHCVHAAGCCCRYYSPYRSVIERSLPLSDTDAATFSVRLKDMARQQAAAGKKHT
jgi:hypothetical protein